VILGTSANLPTPAMAVGHGQVAVPQRIHGGAMEQLRFAGANRLLVGFNYSGKARVTEPYSLRYAETTGNLNFYGWEQSSQQIKCFTVSKMSEVQVLRDTFTPRYHIELGAPGAISHGPWRW
jgi:predicted DNA-binding transcriptional regulator YafY